MSTGGDKRENESTRADSDQAQVMDLDLDFDASGWAFEPSFFVHGEFLLPASPPPPPQSIVPVMLSPPTPSLSSPLWPSEQRNDDRSRSNAPICDSSAVIGISNGDVNRMGQFQIYPSDDSFDMSCIIKERMTQALRHFKESTDQHVLVQVWAPVKNGDHYVLTTSGQPFVLGPQSTGLLQYRTVSLKYRFSVDGDGEGYLGLPGRVFRQKLPEWSPNVQYYTVKEYPRLDYALHYNVRGTLALPVFEPSGQSCVGVVELIMTSQKVNYAPEVDKVCKALEAVNLKSSEILDHPSLQICNDGRQDALAEILEILSMVCEEHKLPLAQTWVPCRHRNVLAHGGGLKKNCSSFDGSCMGQVCMSTTDVAFYVIDAHMWGFRDACVEHHLQKGQGVAGRAYQLRKPCFSRDVTQFCKTEYPLVHYAKMFELASSLAICMQSSQTGDDDYILEFFLPRDCRDAIKQHKLLDSISRMIKQHFRSLKVVTDVDLHEGISFDNIDMLGNDDYELKFKHISSQAVTTKIHTSPGASPTEIPNDSKERENLASEPREQSFAADNAVTNQISVFDSNGSGTSVSLQGNKTNKPTERRRGKAEKSISLDVLQQYFAGSLKDAAKSLGVCPTTMKRICRQHGISRWPSRKINKVNRSLSKLKRVIESVQGAEGAFDLASLTCPLPVAVGSISLPLGLHGSNQINGALSNRETSPSEKAEYLRISPQELIHDQPASLPIPELGKESTGSKSRSSSDAGSAQTPHGSCHESPVTKSRPDEQLELERSTDAIPGFAGDSNLPAIRSMTNAIISNSQPNIDRMLIEDSGSSKDLNNFCSFVRGICKDEPPNTLARSMSFPTAIQDTGIITIKAMYREDILRFRFPCSSGVVALKDEVAKRLKLEIGSFDVKYLDDDNEWVILACDADVDECVEISRLSGGRLIRLAVQDIGTILGSSCESSGC